MRINKRAIEDLTKGPNPPKRVLLWDDKLAGFGLRHTPLGKISYVLKYRVRGDVAQRFETLGDWPSTLPDDARQQAMDIRAAAAQGRDLAAEREQAAQAARAAALEQSRRAVPMTELLDGWRQATEADLAKRLAADQTGSYERSLLRIERSTLRPAIGHLTVGSLDPSTFRALIKGQTSRTGAGMLRALILRVTAYVGQEMERRGLPITWPESYKVTGEVGRRSHRYTMDQMAALWISAGEMGRRGALVRMMMLTGARRSEAARMRHSMVVLADPVHGPHWIQPGGTTKNRMEHRVPLPPPAVALLRWLPARSTRTTPETDFVFAGRGGKVVGNWSAIKDALLDRAGIKDGTLHDFRRSIVSTLGDHGVDIHVADQLLNHKAAATKPGVMGVYQHSEMWKQRRHAVQVWSDLLFQAVDQRLGAQVSRETWGFEAPFQDVVTAVVRDQAPPPGRRRRAGSAPAPSRR